MNDRPASRVRVLDGHCHVASTRFIPWQFLADVAANIHARLVALGQPAKKTRIIDILLSQHVDHEADELVREMDQAGIARTVLLAPDFSRAMRCELDIWEIAESHHRIRQKHPGRFHVFIGVDPRNGPAGVDLFERALDAFGFEGLKLYPPCGYSPSDPRLFPYYEICSARRLPVLLHTGPSAQSLDFALARPTLIDHAARQFPGVNFILAHGGVTYMHECASLCSYRHNLYLDVAGFTGSMHPEGWIAQMRELFRLGINHKVLFGTDYPLGRMGGGLRKVVEEFVKTDGLFSGLRRADRDRVLSGNLERLLAGGANAEPRSESPRDSVSAVAQESRA